MAFYSLMPQPRMETGAWIVAVNCAKFVACGGVKPAEAAAVVAVDPAKKAILLTDQSLA